MAFDFGNILGNPVFLGSFGLSIVGWFISFIGIAIEKQATLNITWFVVFYHLVFNLGLFFAVGTDSVRFYRLAILTFIAVSISFTVTQADLYINSTLSELQAAGAGFVFLAIVDFFWAFLFGAEEGSVIYGFNTVATNKEPISRHPNGLGSVHSPNSIAMVAPQAEHHMSQVIVSPNAEYAYRAEALYEYQANPEDPSELSFSKGDILDIVDKKGKWWQAKKSDGTGISLPYPASNPKAAHKTSHTS